MSEPLRFVVPMPPNMANGRMHWRVKENARSKYFCTLNLMQLAGSFPKAPDPTPARASIHARMFLGAQMDHDNAVARLKWAIDWLRANRYIAGDNPKQLEWDGFPEQVVKRDGNYRIELTVTPL